MKVAAGVLTWNPVSNGRSSLIGRVRKSLADADTLTVFDNGSSDEHNLADHYFPRLPGFPHGNTCGYGMNKIANTLRGEADIVILSNDDIVWKPGAVHQLKSMWTEAPDSLTILSGLIEATFALPDTEPWNQPFGASDLAGHRTLIRKSVPGGAWTYRTVDHDLIFPVSTFPGVDDVPACHKLLSMGRTVACVDLAEHEGIGESTWGNASHERFIIQPVESVREEYDL